jgi:hypothetical protein
MKIACISWGSLVWDPRDLPIRGTWCSDGPLLPVEFLRQSQDGRITLVLSQNAPCVRTLWCLMSITSLDEAIQSLRKREGIPQRNEDRHIGYWSNTNRSSPNIDNTIIHWAYSMGIEAAVWTNLPAKFDKEEREATCDQIVEYLKNLSDESKIKAEEYIRNAPQQIDTEYRRRIEAELGWKPKASDALHITNLNR